MRYWPVAVLLLFCLLTPRGCPAQPAAQDPVAGYLELARNPEAVARVRAIPRLITTDDPRAMAALKALATDPEPSVCLAAITALRRTGHPQPGQPRLNVAAIDPLLAACGVATVPVRAAAAIAFTDLMDELPPTDQRRAIAGLRPLLNDPDVTVQVSAALSLERGRVPEMLPYLVKGLALPEESMRMQCIGAMTRVRDPQAVDPLLALLTDPSERVRGYAAFALSRNLDAGHLPPLLELLASPDVATRRLAVAALGQFDDPRVRDAALTALGDADKDIRTWAVGYFQRFPDPRAVDPLLALLKDPDRPLRQATIGTLGRYHRDAHLTQALLALLPSPDDATRATAAGILGAVGDPVSRHALVQALADPAVSVRRAAARGLSAFGGGSAEGILGLSQPYAMHWVGEETLSEEETVLRDALQAGHDSWSFYPQPTLKYAPEDVTRLLAALRDTDPQVREVMMDVVRRLGDPAAIPALLAGMPGAMPLELRVRLAALAPFSGDPRVTPVLCDALRHPNADVRVAAALAFSPAAAGKAREALIPLLSDEKVAVRLAALWSLEEIEDPRIDTAVFEMVASAPLPARVDQTRGRTARDRAGLLRRLQEVRQLRRLDARSVEAIIAVLPFDEDCAGDALCAIGTPGFQRLQAMLDTAPAATRCTILRVLTRRLHEYRPPLSVLARRLDDPDATVRLAAVDGLHQLADPQAVAPLRRMLQDGSEPVRVMTAVTLLRLGDASGMDLVLRALDTPVELPRKYEYYLDGTDSRVISALGQPGNTRAVEPLIARMKATREPHYRHIFIEALGRIGDARAASALLPLLDTPELVDTTLAALARLRDPHAVPILEERLLHGTRDQRDNAARLVPLLDDPRLLRPLVLAWSRPPASGQGGMLMSFGPTEATAPDNDIIPGYTPESFHASIPAMQHYGPPAGDALIALLGDADPQARQATLKVLIQMPDARAIPALLPLLRDGDPATRALAVQAVGATRDRRGVEPLRAALHDPDALTRAHAVWALGQIGDPREADTLAGALADPDSRMHAWAAVALAALGDRRAAPELLSVIRTHPRALVSGATWHFAALCTPADLAGVVAYLHDHHDVPVDVLANLVDRRAPEKSAHLVPVLLSIAQDTAVTSWARGCCIGDLGILKAKEAVAPLLTLAKEDGGADIHEACCIALGRIGDPRGISYLVQTLKSTDAAQRARAARGLTYAHDPRALPALLEALHTRNERERWQVCGLLGVLKDRRAVPALLDLLDTREMTSAVADALGEIGDPRAVDPLLAALAACDENNQQGIIYALGKLKDRRALEPLMERLRTSNAEYSISSRPLITTLGELGDPRAVETLLQVLPKLDADSLPYLAYSLGQLRDRRAMPALLTLLRTPSPSHLPAFEPYCEDLRAQAARALGEIGDPQAVPGLIAALDAGSMLSRQCAAEALGRLKDRRAVPALTAALPTLAPTARAAAEQALKALQARK
jgi:HEAT repeat protein